MLGVVHPVLPLGGCHCSLAHIGTVTPLRLGADLGGNYSWISLKPLATKLSNTRKGVKLAYIYTVLVLVL